MRHRRDMCSVSCQNSNAQCSWADWQACCNNLAAVAIILLLWQLNRLILDLSSLDIGSPNYFDMKFGWLGVEVFMIMSESNFLMLKRIRYITTRIYLILFVLICQLHLKLNDVISRALKRNDDLRTDEPI